MLEPTNVPHRLLRALRSFKAEETGMIVTVVVGFLYLGAILASGCVPGL